MVDSSRMRLFSLKMVPSGLIEATANKLNVVLLLCQSKMRLEGLAP